MAFVYDTFTDIDSTALEDHIGETGAVWSKHGSYGTGVSLITAQRCRVSSAASCFYAAGSPASPDYTVETPVYVASNSTNAANGVAARINTTANTMYFARYIYTSGWQLFKIVNGSATQLGSSVSQTLTVGSTYVLKLSLIGTAIVVSVDDVQVISVTDSAITDAGKIGFRAVVGSATTGYHLDSIIGADPSAVSVDGEMTLTLEPMVQELTGIVLVSGVSNQLFDNMLVEFYGNVLIAGIQDVAFAAMTQVATGGNIAPLDRTKLKTIFNPFSQKFDYIYVK